MTDLQTQDLDPVERLEAAKLDIKKQIATCKNLLRNENKKLRAIEKLDIETVAEKPKLLEAQIKVVNDLSAQIEELDIDFNNLNRTKEDENEEKIQAALLAVCEGIEKDPSIAYIIDDGQFTYIKDYSTTNLKQNVQHRKLDPAKFIEELASVHKLKAWHLPVPRVKDLFNTMDRTYQLSRFSIDKARWDRKTVYLPIEYMTRYFINMFDIEKENVDDTDIRYFDWLMYSLSGGKLENQEQIEQWILHKIINYDKAVTTPDMVIVGHVGGNGKGILMAIIKLMLPSILSGKANAKTLNGNFNAIMLGKLIVFFDDQNSKEIPLDVVKELAGSDSMIFEPKGKDQYEGEKTHSSAWFNQTLPFKLTPAGQEGGVDRRFSIMATNITFLESIRKHISEEYGQDVSMEECKDLAEVIVRDKLLNRVNIANWFKHLQKKHPQVDRDYTLKPLHGEDYHYFLENQESSLDVVFHDFISPIVKSGGCVPFFVVKELIRCMDNKVVRDSDLRKNLKQLSIQNKLDIDFSKTHVKINANYKDHQKNDVIVRKHVVVIHPAKMSDWKSKNFDWRLVSTAPYNDNRPVGQEIIPDNCCVFGTKQVSESDFETEEVVEEVKIVDFLAAQTKRLKEMSTV